MIISSPNGSAYNLEPVPLSKGKFSITFKGHDMRTSHEVLVKQFNRKLGTSATLKQFILEGSFRADHPNLQSAKDLFRHHNEVYQVHEFIPLPNLKDVLLEGIKPSQREALAITVAKDLLKALDYLHSQHVLHLDIKPSNILVDRIQNRAVLIDLGMASFPGTNRPENLPFSMIYAPPEQVLHITEAINPTSDLFSLALVLLEILQGTSPYKGTHPAEVMTLQVAAPIAVPGKWKLWKAPLERALTKPNFVLPPGKTPKHIQKELTMEAVQHRFASAHELLDALMFL